MTGFNKSIGGEPKYNASDICRISDINRIYCDVCNDYHFVFNAYFWTGKRVRIDEMDVREAYRLGIWEKYEKQGESDYEETLDTEETR